MKNEVMNIVNQICGVESTNCRNLNKSDLATKLMSIANIPQNAKIQEIPLDWDNQVVILFTMPGDSNYYGLFAGIGKDLKFHFDLSIEGIIRNDNTVDFIDDPDILPVDYFKKSGSYQGADVMTIDLIEVKSYIEKAISKQGISKSIMQDAAAEVINYEFANYLESKGLKISDANFKNNCKQLYGILGY